MSSDISSLSDGKGRDQTVPVKSRNIVRAVTPDSVVEEVIHHPEIAITCKKCKNPICVQSLTAHRAYHSALSTLEYTSKKIPQNAASLLKRRNLLVQKLKKEAVESATALNGMQKIDEAYELLKSYLDGTHNERFIGKTKIDLDYRAVALCCSSPCILAVGICWSENTRWKPTMEDARVFQDYFGNDSKKCFFAIYDGHNGRFSADLAANDLHHYLLQEMSKFDTQTNCTCTLNLAELNDLSSYPIERSRPVVRKDSVRHILHEESVNIVQQIMHTCSENVEMLKKEQMAAEKVGKSRDPYAENMSQAFRKAFAKTDHVLSFGVQEQSRVRWSGCSALACVVKSVNSAEDEQTDTMMRGTQTEMLSEDNKEDEESLSELGSIYIANAGNVHAVLCRGGQVHQLTKDHSPANNVEKQRLLKAGVAIHAGGTKGKANGILDATRGLGNHGDPLLKSAILSEPYTMSVKIDQYAEFLILATNGLWEVLTNEEAVEIAQKAIDLEQHTTSVVDQGTYHESENVVKKETDGEFDEALISQIDIEGGNTTESLISVSNGQDLVQFGEDASVMDPNPEGANQTWIDDDDDAMSQKTDFESIISALMENDDGNEADVETVTEMQTIYAKSHLSEKPSLSERVRSVANKVSERLVQAALMAGSKDNITVMVILFPGCKLQEK